MGISKKGGEGFSDEQRKIVVFGFRQKILNRKNWIFKIIFKIGCSNSSRILLRDPKIRIQRYRKPRNLDFRVKIPIFLRPKSWFCIRFDLPVFWPILLMYFILLFFLTMKQQILHMLKHRYVPFSFGKQTYGKISKIDPNESASEMVAPKKTAII